jgi:hypothetical protein
VHRVLPESTRRQRVLATPRLASGASTNAGLRIRSARHRFAATGDTRLGATPRWLEVLNRGQRPDADPDVERNRLDTLLRLPCFALGPARDLPVPAAGLSRSPRGGRESRAREYSPPFSARRTQAVRRLVSGPIAKG